MKKTFTTLLLGVFGICALFAQIPNYSPIPVDFKISTPDGFTAKYDYTSAAGAGTWGMDTLIQTVSGPLEWMFDMDDMGNKGDSLACDSVSQDLTGKIAFIRRGDCNFSLKIFKAQQNGAIGAIIVNWAPESDAANGGLRPMGAGDYGLDVQIPGIFLTKEVGDAIAAMIDAGMAVTGTFEVRSFGSPLHSYCYQTPLAGVTPMKDISVTFVNIDAVNPIPEVTVYATITDPNGQETTLTQVATDLPVLSVNQIKFDESYTPSAVGEYTIKYTNSLNADELEGKFLIDEYTYAQDNNNIIPDTRGTIEPSDSNFYAVYNWNYDFGNFYRTGGQSVVATHVTFILGNPDEIYTGEPGADVFKIRVFNADPDGNGSVPMGHFASYNDLNESGGTLSAIGFTDYALSPDVQPFEPITLELNSPITLDPNGIYLTMVRYNGQLASLGIPPKYAFAGSDPVAGGLASAIFIDSLRTEGWDGYNGVIRLHLDGFSSVDEKPLDNSKISLSPNPASTFVNLNLSLEQPAKDVTVRILDFNGRPVRIQQFENIQKDSLPFDVGDLAPGTYFMSVSTPEGYRSKMFQVIR